MTMMAIDMITKFTDPDRYELIVVNPEPSENIRDDYKTLKIDKQLNPSPDPDYAACMNLGAAEAKGDVLVFIQNDVFVHEGWLDGLLQYLDNGWDVVFPDQVPRTRQYVLDSYKRDPFDPESMKGGRDAGLLMISREAFDKTGGWNPELSLLAEKDFYERMGAAGLKWTDTNKVYIAHIMGATNWRQYHDDFQGYNKRMDSDAKKLNG